MAMRKLGLGRGLGLPEDSNSQYPEWTFDTGMSARVANQLTHKLEKWGIDPDDCEFNVEQRRVFLQHANLGLMVRPQFLDAGYASFCLAGIRLEEGKLQLVEVLTDLVAIATDNGLPYFMFECFHGDFRNVPELLGARELKSPGDFIVETDRLQAALLSIASRPGVTLEIPTTLCLPDLGP
jgi:hypothetical protein